MTDAATPPQASASRTASLDWKSAFADLVSSRLELIRIESKEASRVVLRNLVLVSVVAMMSLFAYICLLAGIVGLTAHYSHGAWWLVALILFLLHGLTALLGIYLLKKKSPAVFPITTNEFQKDRLWLQSLKSQKSND
jgi:uncharacterized membrane protein YqjE